MGEKIIDLGGHNPLDIYGTNNKTLSFILDFLPKIKCVARGNTIKLIGVDESIEVFEHKFSLMLEHFSKYQSLTHSNIERIIYEDNAILQGNNNILVHGPNGKIIKAKTVNQRR